MRLPHADALAAALGLDMAAWFTPTPANYFGRVSREQIAAAHREAKGCEPAPAWLKLKKAEFAARVATALQAGCPRRCVRTAPPMRKPTSQLSHPKRPSRGRFSGCAFGRCRIFLLSATVAERIGKPRTSRLPFPRNRIRRA